ncbi:hypothetical protein LR68_01229 [Anoxybacillus sp. BCO1]|nr:hypothetical protein LR68_01229 [Anoxybacillus sp. BCO1]
MKKWISLLVAAIVVLALAACGKSEKCGRKNE